MLSQNESKSFWNNRFQNYGHTGDADSILYAYDQPLRLKALESIIEDLHLNISQNMSVLDIGCGSGDFLNFFTKYNPRMIIGTDFSNPTLQQTKERFATEPNIHLVNSSIQNLPLPADYFDLIIAINILQHVTDENEFQHSVQNLVTSAQKGTYIIIMDFSPLFVATRYPTSYLCIRSRDEYIQAFTDVNCGFEHEYGLPRIGVRLYRKLKSTVSSKNIDAKAPKPDREERQRKLDISKNSFKHQLWASGANLLLKLIYPLDRLLFPFSTEHTDMRFLIFKKL